MERRREGGREESGGLLKVRTIAGVFFTRLVDVLAFAALVLGAALAFVVFWAEAFFGAALAVAGFA